MSISVLDPATRGVLGRVPVAGAAEVDRTVTAASDAFASWSTLPVVDRARLMFRFADARAEVRRGIEAVEFACGMPSLMMGDALPDVAGGIDSVSVRYPLGVGMVGINVGVTAPMAFFPFGGVKESIFGDLRCHGKDAIAFYTQQRVVISRWPE